jgi:hypothetical protein
MIQATDFLLPDSNPASKMAFFARNADWKLCAFDEKMGRVDYIHVLKQPKNSEKTA